MSAFGFSSTTDEVLADKDLSGKTVFVTGGNSGLGQETGRAMAAKGAQVILAGRDAGKLDEAVAAIKGEQPQANLETILCDLSSLDSIRACTEEAASRFDKIDLLINNAGVMATPHEQTQDGFERQFGTNHLGHFVLTKGLMPLIEKGGDKRIVNLSSIGHHRSPVLFDDVNFEQGEYDPWVSYGQAKTANILFSVGLEKRFASKGIHSYAVHPGGIMTNLSRYMTDEMREALLAIVEGRENFNWKTIPQGAATSCWAATAEELQGKGGVYCEDCHVARADETSPEDGVRPYALDPANADKLWALSEQMTGESFSA